ncbi:MAG: tRNA pseudouridine(38-40) synthase TruA [Myxococcales bacterium]
MERTVRLTVAYDGSEFAGWQLQPRQRTVQGVLEGALEKLLGRAVRVTAAGRTDSGVHAQGQVVSLSLPSGQLPLTAFTKGLNGLLPDDLAVQDAAWAEPGFDARRAARGKLYRYRIQNRPLRSPLHRRTHWEIYRPLDLPAMAEAASSLVGEHDFAAFRASDCPAKTTVRRLDRVALTGETGGEIVLEVRGTAFLKHMVRNLAGTLADVGRRKLRPSDVPRLFAGRDRRAAGPTAPAHGLCLVEVYY